MRKLLAGILALALFAVFDGCSSKTVLSHNALRIARLRTPAIIDPHYDLMSSDNMVSSYVFESFFWISPMGEFEPRLATSMDISDDNLTYTFHLRRGVKFHSGGELKASDVLWSFQRAARSPGMLPHLEPVANIEAPDDYTIVITLKEVNPIFPFMINSICFFSEEAGKKLEAGFTEGNVGTGPYIVTNYRSNEKVILERFDNWYLPPPRIKTLEIYEVADVLTSVMAFENGDIDYIGVSASDWERIKSSGLYSTFQESGSQTVFMNMNHLKEPFTDVRVRQAFNYAINKKDIIMGALEGLADAAYFPGNPAQITYLQDIANNDPYPYNPHKARELLAEAGYPNGLTLSQPITTLSGTAWVFVCEIIQQQLADVGVAAEIAYADPATFFSDQIAGNYVFSIASFAWNIPDWYIYERLFGSAGIGDFNMCFYANPAVDELFKAARATANQQMRSDAFHEIISVLQKDAVMIPLYYTHLAIACNKDLYFNIWRPITEYYWKK